MIVKQPWKFGLCTRSDFRGWRIMTFNWEKKFSFVIFLKIVFPKRANALHQGFPDTRLLFFRSVTQVSTSFPYGVADESVFGLQKCFEFFSSRKYFKMRTFSEFLWNVCCIRDWHISKCFPQQYAREYFLNSYVNASKITGMQTPDNIIIGNNTCYIVYQLPFHRRRRKNL